MRKDRNLDPSPSERRAKDGSACFKIGEDPHYWMVAAREFVRILRRWTERDEVEWPWDCEGSCAAERLKRSFEIYVRVREPRGRTDPSVFRDERAPLPGDLIISERPPPPSTGLVLGREITLDDFRRGTAELAATIMEDEQLRQVGIGRFFELVDAITEAYTEEEAGRQFSMRPILLAQDKARLAGMTVQNVLNRRIGTAMDAEDVARETDAKAKADDPKPEPSPAVELFGPGDPPKVRGQLKKKLTRPRYDTIKALIEAGEAGLTQDELIQRSKHTDAAKILKRMRRDEDWAGVIRMAEVPGGGYRVLFR